MTVHTPHLVVVGAGVIGLGHAVAALDAGYRVTVLERHARAVGASVRNFGHLCASAQAGELRELGRASRPLWQRLHREAGVPLRSAGTLVVARSTAELDLVRAFVDADETEHSVLVDGAEADRLLGRGPDAIGRPALGAAHLPDDLVSAPREAVARIAAWLATRPGAEVRFGCAVVGVEPGRVRLADGTVLAADEIIVAAGHALPELLPGAAGPMSVCRLQMARVEAPGGRRIDPAVLTGSSMARYGAFAALPEAEAVRRELAAEAPELLAIDANVMLTMQPDGTLFLGDSHVSDDAEAPFLDEDVQSTLLAEFADLLGVRRLRVRERWLGAYAISPAQDLLVASPAPGLSAVAVTTGVGMTVALGLGARTIAGLTGGAAPHPDPPRLPARIPLDTRHRTRLEGAPTP